MNLTKIKQASLTPVSAEFRFKTPQEFCAILEQLGQAANSSAWWIGDLLLQGFGKFGEKECLEIVAQVPTLEGLPLPYLALVSQRITPQQRKEKLSWRHHREVALYAPDQAAKLLEQAELNLWTADELHSIVAAPGGSKAVDFSTPVAAVRRIKRNLSKINPSDLVELSDVQKKALLSDLESELNSLHALCKTLKESITSLDNSPQGN